MRLPAVTACGHHHVRIMDWFLGQLVIEARVGHRAVSSWRMSFPRRRESITSWRRIKIQPFRIGSFYQVYLPLSALLLDLFLTYYCRRYVRVFLVINEMMYFVFA